VDDPSSFWNWVEISASVIAGFCFAIPAVRMTAALKQIRDVGENQKTDQPSLEELRDEWADNARKILSHWDKLNHYLILIGFIAFVIAATVKVGSALPALSGHGPP